MKIVLDTNIIVSAFINPKGAPAVIISLGVVKRNKHYNNADCFVLNERSGLLQAMPSLVMRRTSPSLRPAG
jgi:predicted nucleic acid-binding protein